VCRKTLRSYRMCVCVCVYYIIRTCIYEIRLIAREKRTTILYAILPPSRIITIIIIIIIYNWTAAESSRRKEFSTRFCPIHTYTYTRDHYRPCTAYTPLLYYILYSGGRSDLPRTSLFPVFTTDGFPVYFSRICIYRPSIIIIIIIIIIYCYIFISARWVYAVINAHIARL